MANTSITFPVLALPLSAQSLIYQISLILIHFKDSFYGVLPLTRIPLILSIYALFTKLSTFILIISQSISDHISLTQPLHSPLLLLHMLLYPNLIVKFRNHIKYEGTLKPYFDMIIVCYIIVINILYVISVTM